MLFHEGDSTLLCLMLTWEYATSRPTKRLVRYGLASALGRNGCSYKIQAIDLEFGYIIEEWKHEF